ncbi:hypothetical protein POG14_15045 [Clostridium paraputrificum]|uniref:hypothetical protein n=1 Tax=Clostridium paraputrificum TaxID=29363 RepID=UPI0018973358|nr:hypothetical protein [Clostridium paraputrificum]MDC0803504.1 hypothetical protein [Clostridium paraputrificum]
MTYRGWIDAIYDKYQKRYEYLYPKRTLWEKIKSLNKKNKINFIIYIVGFVIAMFLYVLGLFVDNNILTVLGFVILICLVPWLKHVTKFPLELYRNDIRILKEIMKDEGIYTVEIIEKLIKDTSNIAYRLLNGDLSNVVKFLSAILGSVLFKALIDKTSVDLIIYFLQGAIAVTIVIACIYGIYSAYPNSRNSKMKELNEMLKILLIYELGKK